MSPLDPFLLSKYLGRFTKIGSWFLSPGYNAPFASPIPYFLTVHDLNHVDRPENSSTLKRMYYKTILRRLCLNARGVFTVSEFSRQRVVEWFGVPDTNVFSVGNGVSSAFSNEGSCVLEYDEYVLCVSNRKGHKNEAGLLKAFAAANLPAALKLVLTGEETGELAALAAKLGLSSRLVFAGRVSEERLATLYRSALFMVFPSFYEGFGLPIVEAYASGTPVITSNLTSMPEIAGDAALLIDPHDIEQMASEIRRLYLSESLRQDLSRRGLVRAKEFSWDKVAERVKAAVKARDIDPNWPLSWKSETS